MKKFALLLFLASTTIFVSCSSDDDNSTEIDQSLLPGEWNLTEIRSEDGKITATVSGIPLSGDYSVTGKDFTAKATFTASTAENEPNTVIGSGGFTIVATVTIPTQDAIEEERTVPEFIDSAAEWTLEGNTLTITAQGESVAYVITSLSPQSMTLRFSLDEEITIPELDNIEAKITGEQFFVLTKQ